jgi:hypothetical protein
MSEAKSIVWSITVATIVPSFIPLLVVYAMWGALEEVPHIAVVVLLLSLLPLTVQLCRWGYRHAELGPSGNVEPQHPDGIVLPLGLLLVLPLWPLGERVARQIPSLCETIVGENVMTERPGKFSRNAIFSVQVHGWGNLRSFGFTGGVIVYSGRDRKFDDLYFNLPGRRGHWTNSYTTFFPLTREVVGEYVRRSDDFPPGEAEAAADVIWDALNRYAEKRDLPPMIDYFPQGEEPRIVYYVPSLTIYLASSFLAILPLAVLSWLLARWYYRRMLHTKGERLPD